MSTLRDRGITSLHDAASGRSVADADGTPDDPADYEVLAEHATRGGYTFLAVRGPSGAIDVAGPDGGGLHRDAIDDVGSLADWVEANYPG